MGDSIILEGGQLWGGASRFVRSVLSRISDHIENDRELSVWLKDCSGRSNGMVGFDLRGLSKDGIFSK